MASPQNSPPNTPSKHPNDSFRVLDTIRDPDGVIATITERIADGRISFSLAREITKGNQTTRTAYLARRHLPAVRRLLDDLNDRLELAEDRARTKHR
jgi:hypothetical protein